MLLLGIIFGCIVWEVAGEQIKLVYGKLRHGKEWVIKTKAKLNKKD